jgi:hypothetical protein
MKQIVRLVLILTFLSINESNAQWFDEIALKSSVHIEICKDDTFKSLGTGFLLAWSDDVTRAVLVTCAHIVKNKSEIFVTVNVDRQFLNWAVKNNMKHVTIRDSIDQGVIKDEKTWDIDANYIRTKLILQNEVMVIHKDLDIAVVYLDLPNIKMQVNEQDSIIRTIINKPIYQSLKGITVFQKSYILPDNILSKDQVMLGDNIFFVGFPFGLGTTPILQPVVRSGIVAWKSEYHSNFLLDALSFGGNSGSAVFSQKSNSKDAKLIGMVTGHIDTVINKTGEKSFINAGLVTCVWIDDIGKTVDELGNLKIARDALRKK